MALKRKYPNVKTNLVEHDSHVYDINNRGIQILIRF